MRVDHLAYQRATNVSGLGFLVQAALGTVLLVLGLALGDTATTTAAVWILMGLAVWVGLLVVFNQHRLERLESLEADEIGTAATAIFERGGEASQPAARRLRGIYRWMLPITSLFFVGGLVVAGWLLLSGIRGSGDGIDVADFGITEHRGWMVSIDLAFAVVAFIFSRFAAGMAEQDAWRNLRAGAGIMVGNTLVLLALAVGFVFKFFDLPGVLEGVAVGITIFMFAVALEVTLAFVLNVYRPRMAGEFPRAAFDSRALSLLSRPDSFVRSINEAVNYQFGFDISSSWGYQLLLRSGAWLGVLAIGALLAMSTLVVVDGRQEGLRLRSGRIIEADGHAVHGPGAFWKLPWPFESAQLVDVTLVRDLSVTPEPTGDVTYDDWSNPPSVKKTRDGDHPFLVQPAPIGDRTQLLPDSISGQSDASIQAGDLFAVMRAQISLQWRVRGESEDDSGVLEYLSFGGDERNRRDPFTTRQRILRELTYAQATAYFSTLTLDEALTTDRGQIGQEIASRLQARLDELDSGIEVVSVDLPTVAPPKDAVLSFEDLPAAVQQRDQTIAIAKRDRVKLFTEMVGDPSLIDPVIEAIDAADKARRHLESLEPADAGAVAEADKAYTEAMDKAEAMLRRGGGVAYQVIAGSELDSWIELMARRVQASRVRGQEAAWKAAPEIFRQRAIMDIYSARLPDMRKYVLGIDPERVDLSYEVRELASPNTVFSDMLSDEQRKETEE